MSVPEVLPDNDGYFEVWLGGTCCGYGLTLAEAHAMAGAAAIWQEREWGDFPAPRDAPTTRPGGPKA
jgi:hypothetical protein